MKKFMFLYYGFVTSTPEIGAAWMKWFGTFEDNIVDSGNPFSRGREISHDGTKELPLEADSCTGYTIINAESLDDAEKIAQGCPMIHSTKVYEMGSM